MFSISLNSFIRGVFFYRCSCSLVSVRVSGVLTCDGFFTYEPCWAPSYSDKKCTSRMRRLRPGIQGCCSSVFSSASRARPDRCQAWSIQRPECWSIAQPTCGSFPWPPSPSCYQVAKLQHGAKSLGIRLLTSTAAMCTVRNAKQL